MVSKTTRLSITHLHSTHLRSMQTRRLTLSKPATLYQVFYPVSSNISCPAVLCLCSVSCRLGSYRGLSPTCYYGLAEVQLDPTPIDFLSCCQMPVLLLIEVYLQGFKTSLDLGCVPIRTIPSRSLPTSRAGLSTSAASAVTAEPPTAITRAPAVSRWQQRWCRCTGSFGRRSHW